MPEWRDLLKPPVREALERYIAAQEEPESLPEAVNSILMDWLSSRGHLPVQELPEGED